MPQQLQIDYLTKLGTAGENPVGTLRTAASAPGPLCRRLLPRNIQLQLMTGPLGAMFLLPMTKLLQHTNLPSLLLTVRQKCLLALRLMPSAVWTLTPACN